PITHCVKGTEGWNLYGELENSLKNRTCFEKCTFGSDALFDFLRASEYESVELIGLVSNICIISNAIIAKTALPEAEIIVDASCTDSFDKELHNKALDVMQGLQITVINK
ncbi:MAG: cysteine hydrolase family protein, partial [Oscillospiraceae bacterium]